MKSLKIAASWALFLLGMLSLVLCVGGAIVGVLKACAWVMGVTIGYWCIPAALALLIVCALVFFWLNPIKGEPMVKNKPNGVAYKEDR